MKCTIGFSVFDGCRNLRNVYITDLDVWCDIDFGDMAASPLYYYPKLYLNNQEVTDLKIPQNTVIIKPYTFYMRIKKEIT